MPRPAARRTWRIGTLRCPACRGAARAGGPGRRGRLGAASAAGHDPRIGHSRHGDVILHSARRAPAPPASKPAPRGACAPRRPPARPFVALDQAGHDALRIGHSRHADVMARQWVSPDRFGAWHPFPPAGHPVSPPGGGASRPPPLSRGRGRGGRRAPVCGDGAPGCRIVRAGCFVATRGPLYNCGDCDAAPFVRGCGRGTGHAPVAPGRPETRDPSSGPLRAARSLP